MSVNTITPNATAILKQTPLNAPAVLPLAFASSGVAIIVVSLRLYCRYFLTKKAWWDDGIIVLALFGWGHHSKDIPPLAAYVVGVLKTLWISEILLSISTGLTKCSILFFYIRITNGGAHPTLRIMTITSLVLIAIYTVAIILIICLQCVPTYNFWSILKYSDRAAACASYSAKLSFFLGQGITNTIGDFVVVLLPAKQILSLKLPMRQKAVVVALFWLGVLASIASAIRMIYIVQSFGTPDNTWNGSITFSLGSFEVNTGIICASIPEDLCLRLSKAIKPLILAIFPRYSATRPFQSTTAATLWKSSKFSSQAESTIVDMTQVDAEIGHVQ